MRQEAISHFYFHVNCLPQSCPSLPAFNSTAKPKRAQEIQAAIGGATCPPSTLLPALSLSLLPPVPLRRRRIPRSCRLRLHSPHTQPYLPNPPPLPPPPPPRPERPPLPLLRRQDPHPRPRAPLLINTSATHGRVSPNGIRINKSVLFDDASFTPLSTSSILPLGSPFSLPILSPSPLPSSRASPSNPSRYLALAAIKLRSMGSPRSPRLLVSSWIGATGALGSCKGNFSEHLAVFQRHAVPCRLTGGDLAETMMPTLAEDFTISVD